MKRFIALARRGNVTPSGILFIGMLLISFGLVGCGGKLGKIETISSGYGNRRRRDGAHSRRRR